MKSNRKMWIVLTALLLVFALFTLLSACADRSAYALDYTVEDALYSDELTEQEPELDTTPESESYITLEPDVDTTQVLDESATEEDESATEEAEEGTLPEAETTPVVTDPIEIPAEITPSPDGTESTPVPENTVAPEATPLLEQARYNIIVHNEFGEAMTGVRVELNMDGGFLYSAITDVDGLVFWLLPTGHAYSASAQYSGYIENGNSSSTANLSADMTGSITLVTKEGENVETPEPTATPIPVPTPVSGIVTIIAADVEIMAGDTTFSLTDGVSALTSANETVPVWVVDDGGYNSDITGEYLITYGAMQEGELVTVTRFVRVIGESDSDEVTETPSEPTGSSAQRYEILLTYRNEIYDSLTAKIEELSQQYKDKVTSIAANDANVRILAQSSVENDTDAVPDESTEFAQVQEVKVRNWSDVLATFIAQSSLDVDQPLDLIKLRALSLDQLDEVFWRMNSVDVIRIDGVTNIILDTKTYEDMADEYNMEIQRRDFLYELMQPEFQRTFASLTGNIAFIDAQSPDIERIRQTLPEDLEIERKEIVETAFSLVGKVSYLWGGKYNKLGWNDRWGLPCSVTTEQNGQSVVVERTGGLDCSGFVSWVFINATGDAGVIDAIGNGSSNQWAHATAVSWDKGKPGDLVFYYVPGERQFNHVGIIVSVDDDGSYLVAHCSARKNGVVITEAWSTGFRYIRRPVLLVTEDGN